MATLETKVVKQWNYDQWNRELITYFTDSIPRGTKIYLNVDEYLIESLGSLDNFAEAVYGKVVKGSCTIDLNFIKGNDREGYPKGVAFLALSVLAAHQMAEDGEISEKNYFKRLRYLLKLSGEGRPSGMKNGAEENLWKVWNVWLLKKSLQPSAEKGEGPKKYIKYPISQCLLRQTDKDKLQKLFALEKWKDPCDDQTLFSRVRSHKKSLIKHLQELLEDGRRFEALMQAIHEVFEQWLAEGCPSDPILKTKYRRSRRNLFAGIYRVEDPFLDEVEYHFYLKGKKLTELDIKYQNEKLKLTEDRTGWYFPEVELLKVRDLKKGRIYQITSSSGLEKLIFPVRDFWILIPDPDHPDSGVYASWRKPEILTKFILLCKRELLSDLEKLNDEGILKWDGDYQAVDEKATWLEFRDCMVLSQSWETVFLDFEELKDYLKPTEKLAIHFSGGLRVINQNAWLEGYPPMMTIAGFPLDLKLKIINLSNDEIEIEKNLKTNQEISLLEPLKEGTYQIQAIHGDKFAEKFLRITSWQKLEFAKIKPNDLMSSPQYSIYDNLIEPFID
jgi:hypothetical protein